MRKQAFREGRGREVVQVHHVSVVLPSLIPCTYSWNPSMNLTAAARCSPVMYTRGMPAQRNTHDSSCCPQIFRSSRYPPTQQPKFVQIAAAEGWESRWCNATGENQQQLFLPGLIGNRVRHLGPPGATDLNRKELLKPSPFNSHFFRFDRFSRMRARAPPQGKVTVKTAANPRIHPIFARKSIKSVLLIIDYKRGARSRDCVQRV